MGEFPKFQLYPGDPTYPFPIIELLLPPAPPVDAHLQRFIRTDLRGKPTRHGDSPVTLFPGISSGMFCLPADGNVTFYCPLRLLDVNNNTVDIHGKTWSVAEIPSYTSPLWYTHSVPFSELWDGKYGARPITTIMPRFSIKTERPNVAYNSGIAFLDNKLDESYTDASGTVPAGGSLVHFTLDFGTVIAVKSISILFGTYNSATGATQYLEISSDGTTWTSIASWSTHWSSDYNYFYFRRLVGNWSFRYIRLRTVTAAGTTQYMYLYHLVIFQ